MRKLLKRLHRTGRRAREIIGSYRQGGAPCGTCGFAGAPLHRHVLWPGLIAEWELTSQWARWIDAREGSRCAWCGSSLRSGQLSCAILAAANARSGSGAKRLSDLFKDSRARRLAIAEINSAGNLHRYLARCPGLRFSEFGSSSPLVPSEDLTALSYADASFDLVITSDTLEHVPDIDRALRETLRVLRPGGAHVFSVPVVWDRATRQRATIEGGVLKHLLPPSHHGAPAEGKSDFLVFYEFGADFVDRCRGAGFEVELLRDSQNPALVTFIARRPDC
jgi:SAM-dependent methyltransferase